VVTVAASVLGDIVGAAHVRDAVDADNIGGIVPSLVVSPGSEEEVAAVLSCASREGLCVVVRGGGTKLDWGAPPRRCDVVLSQARLDAVVEHEPGDLVCVAQAGVRLGALQALLAPHRQALMLDPPHGVAATLGGIAAAGAWGPLRTRYGTMRDLVIGARFVLADGTIGHSGGKVVKNVAGYDVAKLLIGSLGTLAVLTELSLRLHPLPRESRTLVWTGLSARDLDAVWWALEAAPVVAAKVVALWPSGELLVQLDGGDDPVLADARELDAAEADVAWSRVGDAMTASGAPVAAIAVPRTAMVALLDRLGADAESAVVLPSVGVAEAQLSPSTSADAVAALREWAEQHGGHLVLRRPTAALAGVTWPARDDDAVDLMRAVKRSLDPGGTLAPGRMLGGI
jgi:glycolate oxidase FAD binding subunit